jgi:hypothetical protein
LVPVPLPVLELAEQTALSRLIGEPVDLPSTGVNPGAVFRDRAQPAIAVTRAGAEIFATASSNQRREFLCDMGFDHI